MKILPVGTKVKRSFDFDQVSFGTVKFVRSANGKSWQDIEYCVAWDDGDYSRVTRMALVFIGCYLDDFQDKIKDRLG